MAIHSGRLADPTSRHLGTVGLRCVNLCNSASPWQILVSHATEALLEGEGAKVSLRDLGERTLRNLEHPVHVYEVAD
jgi:class 3 adenylate cyclase